MAMLRVGPAAYVDPDAVRGFEWSDLTKTFLINVGTDRMITAADYTPSSAGPIHLESAAKRLAADISHQQSRS